MKRWTLLPILAALLAGCQAEQYATQPLGNVPYAEAFRVGKTVLAQYFSIESADPESGRIVGRPRAIDSPKPDRLLGTSSGRQLARMRIRQEGQDAVVAEIAIHIQRQDVAAFRQMQPVTVHNELPGRTPAEESGPLSAEQEQAWQDTGRDYALERTILNDLLNAVAAYRQPPTTAPARPVE